MLPRREQMRLRWAGVIRRLSAGYANLPRRLALEQIVGERNRLCLEARLSAVYLLKPYKGEGLSGPRPQTAGEAIERIQAIGEMESARLREALPDDQPATLMQPALHRERDVLERALTGVPVFELLVPRVRNPSALVAADPARDRPDREQLMAGRKDGATSLSRASRESTRSGDGSGPSGSCRPRFACRSTAVRPPWS